MHLLVLCYTRICYETSGLYYKHIMIVNDDSLKWLLHDGEDRSKLGLF